MFLPAKKLADSAVTGKEGRGKKGGKGKGGGKGQRMWLTLLFLPQLFIWLRERRGQGGREGVLKKKEKRRGGRRQDVRCRLLCLLPPTGKVEERGKKKRARPPLCALIRARPEVDREGESQRGAGGGNRSVIFSLTKL